MDLPVLMMAVEQEQRDLLEAAVKMAKVALKDEKKDLLNLWMELNPETQSITFRPFAYEKERSERQFNYLGKNAAAATQIYAVREGNSLEDYGIGKPKGLFMNLLNWQAKRGGQLYEALCECRDAGLFDENGLNIHCIPGVTSTTTVQTDEKKKKVTIKDEQDEFTTEKWLMNLLDMESKQKIVLIVPVILSKKGRLVISRHEDYCDTLRKELSGEKDADSGKKSKKKQNQEHVCHLCGRRTADIDTVNYSTKMDRASVGKVFVTTLVNYAYSFDKKNYAKNFALCKDCYMRWKSAERVVMQDYRLRIAGEEAVVLVDGILGDLDHEDISRIKANVDCAFHPGNMEKWLMELHEDSLDLQDIDLYEFNLLFYLSDGKSCSVHKTIEDISGTWFERVMDVFAKIRKNPDYERVLRGYSLGSLYHMIPVRTYGTDKKQLIDEVLDVYSRMLQGHAFSRKQLMAFLANALYWGQKEMFASDISNYSNLHMLRSYHDKVRNKDIRGFEWYVEYMCQAYQAWMEILESLGLLTREEETAIVETENVKYEWLKEKEEYLTRHNFSDEAKGMYYVGAMMYQIGVMQYHQGHKDKPILQKVTYSGMSQREMIELLNELHDKIRQYRKAMEANNKYYLVLKAEVFAERAFQYLGNLPMDKKTDEHANLFYLMSGYSSCVSIMKKDGGNDDDENE